jgi:hypothetical protein
MLGRQHAESPNHSARFNADDQAADKPECGVQFALETVSRCAEKAARTTQKGRREPTAYDLQIVLTERRRTDVRTVRARVFAGVG